jgi:hypothetical protein
MPKRPYLAKKGPELQELAQKLWNDAGALTDILDELGFRTKPKAAQLAARIRDRIKQLKVAAVVRGLEKTGYEKADVLKMLSYDQSRYIPDNERRTLLKFINEQARENMPKGCGDPQSATRRILILECLGDRLKHARKMKARGEEQMLREDIKFVENNFF